jgi:hypothetical protein
MDRSIVPGWRSSERVADVASEAGSFLRGVRGQLFEEDIALFGCQLCERLAVYLVDGFRGRGTQQVAVALDGDLILAALWRGGSRTTILRLGRRLWFRPAQQTIEEAHDYLLSLEEGF